jgi:5-methylcytosine-specific restriction protein A
MTYQILGEDGRPIDAYAEVDPLGITLHSRGGGSESGSAQNTDYGLALRLLLRRISAEAIPLERAFVDSSRVQSIAIPDRTILSAQELDQDGAKAFTMMSNRMKAVGQGSVREGGNPTKRVRIQFAKNIALPELLSKLRVVRIAKDLRSADRLPVEELDRVNAEHVWNAVEKLRAGTDHAFGPSTDFDLVTDTGERFPPKAVFGLAASEALGFEVQPKHFTGGTGTPCFRTLEAAGFTIVPKSEAVPSLNIPASQEDREWAEGQPKLVSHLKKERASGLAQAKKENFIRLHGRLMCERCGMDPIAVYVGQHGLACIEVHHKAVHVEDMTETHRTKLEDLQCLCANCHRVVHAEMKATNRYELSSGL